jgi:hypothetical protein
MASGIVLAKHSKNKKIKKSTNPGVVAHACDPSMQEAEVGGLRVQGPTGLHRGTQSQKKKKKNQPIH